MDADLISKIMNQVGSDKSSRHRYESAYSELLSEKQVDNLLEIGIANSKREQSSLWGWSLLFPDSKIYGIDIVESKMINENNIKSFVVDQSNFDSLTKFVESVGHKMDVIIDDGSHHFEHASLTFEVFFDNLLSDNGVYIIEDIQKNLGYKNSIMYNQQCLVEWEDFLKTENISNFKTFDCIPELNDDSLILAVWK